MSPMPRRKVWLVVVANGPINLPETSTSNRIERLPQTEQNRNAMPLPLPETSGKGSSCELGMKIGRITMEVEAEKGVGSRKRTNLPELRYARRHLSQSTTFPQTPPGNPRVGICLSIEFTYNNRHRANRSTHALTEGWQSG